MLHGQKELQRNINQTWLFYVINKIRIVILKQFSYIAQKANEELY